MCKYAIVNSLLRVNFFQGKTLRYGIRIRCSKRLPPVRDAFSEAFGVKNRLLRYGRDIRCAKQPPVVRDAFSKARRTASCRTGRIFRGVPRQKQHLPQRQPLQCAKQPPLSLFAPAPSLAPSTALGTFDGTRYQKRHSVPETAHRSEVSKYKKRMTSKSIKTFSSSPFFYNNQSADYQKLNFSMACTR